MTRLIFNKGILNVIISEEEQLNIDNAKELVRKTRRMIIQNKASCLVIEIDTISKVNENAFRGPTYVVQSDVVSIDNKDASLQVWGGYRLADWVSMEARYSTLGE